MHHEIDMYAVEGLLEGRPSLLVGELGFPWRGAVAEVAVALDITGIALLSSR